MISGHKLAVDLAKELRLTKSLNGGSTVDTSGLALGRVANIGKFGDALRDRAGSKFDIDIRRQGVISYINENWLSSILSRPEFDSFADPDQVLEDLLASSVIDTATAERPLTDINADRPSIRKFKGKAGGLKIVTRIADRPSPFYGGYVIAGERDASRDFYGVENGSRYTGANPGAPQHLITLAVVRDSNYGYVNDFVKDLGSELPTSLEFGPLDVIETEV